MSINIISLQVALIFIATFNIVSSATTVAPAPTLDPAGTPYARPTDFNPVPVPSTASKAGDPVLKSFLSYSIELAFFPDFAGNKANPNTFSDTLLENLKGFQGSKPNIRVGGNTQDYATFDSSLKSATNGTYTSVSKDYPRILSIGPSFFESYQTWPDVQFIHGFNLAKNDSAAFGSIRDSISYACDALSKNNLLAWEMGNEPDLYKTSAQGIVRPASWSEADYVKEWTARVTVVKDELKQKCGEDWVSNQKFKWIAPSFAGTKNSLDAVKAWNAGLDASNRNIAQFSSHNYISGATQPGITLANTLLNHTKTVSSIAAHNAEQKSLTAAGTTVPYILGETNSLYNQGASGLSNSFGAALWNVDFALLCAATNIQQVYMHQGTDYRYASWQPVSTSKTILGTKAPYYGNIATAAALGSITADTRVQNIPLKNVNAATSVAYAIYAGSKLARLMIINLNQYNYTAATPSSRPYTTYNFTVAASCAGVGIVQRLIANGSDATTGITFNGASYDYEIAKGKPKLVDHATKDEIVWVGQDGGVAVQVPDSSAALMQLTC